MSFTHMFALLLLCCTFIHTGDGGFAHCQFAWEMQSAKMECLTRLKQQTPATTGCPMRWDSILCWQSAAFDEVKTLPCPHILVRLFGKEGTLNRNCTKRGWSSVYPDVAEACTTNDPDAPNDLAFYKLIKDLACVGHSLSLIALVISAFIISLYRRLRCTRNYIHLNLFVSFILRAAAVLTKDTLLFSDDDNIDCSTKPSLVGCKASLVLFHYFVMANFFWLLVEGLYLHMLLIVVHTFSARLLIYMLIGWGIPLVFTVAWVICRINLEDTTCWEMNEHPVPNRLINWPIMMSIILNFLLFISIIRILVQKLCCTDVGGNVQSQYRRLAKSTLLLIPLFGINYVVFVFLMESSSKTMQHVKVFFDLGLGSFQGLIVAVLYCFLNSEVQFEVRRSWRGLSLMRFLGQEPSQNTTSTGTENSSPLSRSCRAQPVPQTETSML